MFAFLVAAGIGGLGLNVLRGDDFLSVNPWGFAGSAIAAAAALAFVLVRRRRGEADEIIDG